MSIPTNHETQDENYFQSLLDDGFTIRPATLADMPDIVQMINNAEREILDSDPFTVDRYTQELSVPGFDLAQNTRIVINHANQVVGLVEVWDIQDPPTHPWIYARVDPEWRNKGIGTALTHWAFARAQQALKRLDPEIRLAPRAGTVQNHQPSTKLLEDLGMLPVRFGWTMVTRMEEPPPDPEWPPGLSVRTYQHPDEARAVHHAIEEAFRDHWGYIERDLDESFEQWQHFMFNTFEFDPSLWFLATDGDEIAGMAICLPRSDEDPEMGWVEVLGVRRPWRRRGLGLALLHHVFGVFYDRGLRKVGLGVDSKNLSGATRIYQKAGMDIHREHVTYEIELRPGKELAKMES